MEFDLPIRKKKFLELNSISHRSYFNVVLVLSHELILMKYRTK